MFAATLLKAKVDVREDGPGYEGTIRDRRVVQLSLRQKGMPEASAQGAGLLVSSPATRFVQ